MADAELGVVVSVQGASEGAAQLDKFALSAKGAAASTTDLANARTKSEAQWTNQTGVKTAAAETTKLATATAATTQSTGLMQRAWQAVTGMFSGYGTQAEGASVSLNHLAGAHGEVAKGMHLLNAVAYSAGTSIGGVGQFAMLARGGLLALAAGITATVTISLEKLAEDITVLKNNLNSLYGDKAGGKVFDQIKQSADTAGGSVKSLADAVTAYNSAIDRASVSFKKPGTDVIGSTWVTPPVTDGSDRAVSAIETMRELEQLLGKTGTAATDAVAGVIGAIGKEGTITADVWEKLKKDLPGTAAALANDLLKFDSGDTLKKMNDLTLLLTDHTTSWGEEVKAVSFPLATLENTLRKIKESTDAAFKAMSPTVAQSVDNLKNSVIELWSELSKTTIGSTTITKITNAVKEMNTSVKNGVPLWEAFDKAINDLTPNDNFEAYLKTLNGMFSSLNDKIREFLGFGELNIAIHAPTDTSGFDGFINRLISDLDNLVSRAASAAASVLDYLKRMGTAVTAAQIAANTGGSSYADTQPGVSFDATGVGISGAGNTIEGFATGGTFTVGGSGAQTPVNFMGTPGEIVSVTPVGGNAGSVFQVGGLGGVDSTLVQFSATPGSTITITPVGLTPPQSQGLKPVSGLVTHVPGMPTLALGGKVVNQATTTATASTSAAAAASANPYSMFGVGGTGDAKIVPWKGNPAGTQSNYVSNAEIYGYGKFSDANMFGQPPTPDNRVMTTTAKPGIGGPNDPGRFPSPLRDAPPSGINNSFGKQPPLTESGGGWDTTGMTTNDWNIYPAYSGNSSFYDTSATGQNIFDQSTYAPSYYDTSAGYDTQGMASTTDWNVYAPNTSPYDESTFVGDYQTGGSFKVRGGGAPDSKMVSMRLSPNENVVISRPNAGKSDKAMNVTLNINGNISPLAFVAAEAQVKRAARRIFS